jgi:predicted RNA-binding protein with PUA-like domain
MSNRWLLKTEPSAYSFQQLEKDKRTVWDGVKNNLALKHLAAIKKDDQILVYHTGDEKAVVGVARAASAAYPDPGTKEPRRVVFDIEAEKPLARPVTLAEIKAVPKFKSFDLVRLPRLSVMPVSEEQWRAIEEMARR